MTHYHTPALLAETLEQLITTPHGIYIDATFGGGGHSRAILQQLAPDGHLFSFDQDADACHQAEQITDPRFTFVHANFRFLPHFMSFYGIEEVHGILADLGVSSHHLDDAGRGFAFRFDAPIDMRMNQKAPRTALELIAESSEEELANILYNFGEIRTSRKMARLIKEHHTQGQLHTAQDLLNAVKPLLPEHDKRGLAQLFQALRIAVNNEMGVLTELLTHGAQLLAPQGRFAVITYHSLEDRPTKNFFRTGNCEGSRQTDLYGKLLAPLKPLHSKPTTPSAQEVALNPRARSAKLRTAIKI